MKSVNHVRESIQILVLIAFLLFLPTGFSGIGSQSHSSSASLRMKGYEDHLVLKRKSIFKNFHWRFIGPVWMSGRVTDIAISKNKYQTIYVASASGGVWKTEDGAKTWKPIFEHSASTSIGDIEVFLSNPDILWVGTGENNSSRSSYPGTGVYKTINGGKTWQHMGLPDSFHIGRIQIDPKNPEIVFVAALGRLYSYNPERGIYLTLDGGKSWERVLYINERTGFIDLVMDPSNSNNLYAASWERLRKPWNMWEAGPGSGIFKTTNKGKTWKKCLNGLPPEGNLGRIGIDVSKSNPNVVYALVDNHTARKKAKKREFDPYGFKNEVAIKGAEVYRSDDRGDSWIQVNQQNISELYQTLGYYFGNIRVNPQDMNSLYLLGINLMKSQDGGKTYEVLQDRTLHEDHHALWIDPGNPKYLIDGNDGGINVSYDGGKNWKEIHNLPIVQFYHINCDGERPFQVYGSAQDHGCFKGPINHDPATDDPREWQRIEGGEASYIALDSSDSNIFYSEDLYGQLYRMNRKNKRIRNIRPKSRKGVPALRCNWLTPFIISPHNTSVIYFGCQFLFCSKDRGNHWQKISPDLTQPDPEKNGDVPFGTITTFSESEIKAGLLYVGTDDGNVQVTENGGTDWSRIGEGIPKNKWVSRIVASRFSEGLVYMSLTGLRNDDFQPYLFKSSNYGKTWENITSNLPYASINVIREDPRSDKILYVGTDLGIYASLDKGKKWHLLSVDIPTVYVQDIIIHPRDQILVAATHGRGIFALDILPLQLFNDQMKENLIKLWPFLN